MALPAVKQMLQALPALSRAQMRPLVAPEKRALSYRAVQEQVCVCVHLSFKDLKKKEREKEHNLFVDVMLMHPDVFS